MLVIERIRLDARSGDMHEQHPRTAFLACPKCGSKFTEEWIGSETGIRVEYMRNPLNLQCNVCTFGTVPGRIGDGI